jgi:ribosomal protein L7/L12
MSESDFDDKLIQDVTEALERGQKLEAIKLYRDASGKGLRESKEFVEALIPGLLEKDPERFAKLAKQGGGCGAAILAAVSIGILVAAVLS